MQEIKCALKWVYIGIHIKYGPLAFWNFSLLQKIKGIKVQNSTRVPMSHFAVKAECNFGLVSTDKKVPITNEFEFFVAYCPTGY